MYGYVKIYRPELKYREADFYQSVYCGLCRAHGSCTGHCSRMFLSYDMTFFALFRAILTDDLTSIERHRCLIHPIRKLPMMSQNEALRYTAGISSLLLWHKVEDDRKDEHGVKRIKTLAVRPLASSGYRRANKSLSITVPNNANGAEDSPNAIIIKYMTELTTLETQKISSADIPAQVFGEMMGALLAYRLDGYRTRIARQVGVHMGRWVYLLDAADDYEKDFRTRAYNPLIYLYGGGEPILSTQRKEELMTALQMEINGIMQAYELLNTNQKDADGVIRNVITQGMPYTARNVLFPTAQNDEKGREKREGITYT